LNKKLRPSLKSLWESHKTSRIRKSLRE